jgi:signal recognition particle receptor subunit beta
MVVYNYSGREINAKIVYYGPALSGKTTNLEWIYSKIPTEYSGKMVSLRTQADRTIFFDFLPLELGLIDGYKTRFMLYTVPGQVYYNATRKMVLKGVDGLVFVADSQEDRVAANLESWQNLKENLAELGLDAASLPVVLQWNKRDLPGCVSASDMDAQLNEFGVPAFEASALTGEGVYETLHRICRMMYHKLTLGDHASATNGGDLEDPATSLFGEAIAARLQELDLPMPEPEPVAVPAGSSLRNEDSTSAPPVMQAILNGAGAEPRPGVHMRQPQTPIIGNPTGPSEQTPSPGAPVEAGSSHTSPQAASPPPPPGRSPSSQPTAPIRPVGTAPTEEHSSASTTPPSAESGLSPSADSGVSSSADPTASSPTGPSSPPEEEQDALVSDLVDQVLVQLDESEQSAGSATPPVAEVPQTAAPQASSGFTEPPDAVPPTGSVAAEGLQSLLDGDPSGASAPAADPLASAEGGAPVAGDQPEIEHDVDLFETMAGDSRDVPTEEVGEAPLATDVEEFDLITDPLRLSGESRPEPTESGRTSSVAPFGGPISNAKVLEVPITLDADALADGKTIRIVLNLQMKR